MEVLGRFGYFLPNETNDVPSMRDNGIEIETAEGRFFV
jgi:hypothetical protein